MAYQLPDNVEKGCLYLLKHDMEFYSQLAPIIKREYFKFPSYQKIFDGIKGYFEKYKKLPSDKTLLDYIKVAAQNDPKDTNDYEDDILQINQIDKEVFQHKDFILDTIEDFAKQSAMKEAIKRSYVMLTEGNIGSIESVVREALLVNRNVETGQDYFNSVSDRLYRVYQKKSENRFPTVFRKCDEALEGGLCKKELAMVVAPPGVGKSLYLVNQGAKTLLSGKNVLYISCEMSEDKIGNRFDSVLSLIKNSKLKEPASQIKLHERLGKVKEKTPGRLIIKEFPTGTANVSHIRSLLTQLHLYKDFKPDLLIVDYLELLRPLRVIDSEYMAQQRIAEELRGLATEYNCLMWTASQTNRQARKVSIITDAELGDSYGKIRPADWAISLNQTKEEYDEGKMRVWVLKARDSKQHYIVNATIDYSTLRMEEASCEETIEIT